MKELPLVGGALKVNEVLDACGPAAPKQKVEVGWRLCGGVVGEMGGRWLWPWGWLVGVAGAK